MIDSLIDSLIDSFSGSEELSPERMLCSVPSGEALRFGPPVPLDTQWPAQWPGPQPSLVASGGGRQAQVTFQTIGCYLYVFFTCKNHLIRNLNHRTAFRTPKERQRSNSSMLVPGHVTFSFMEVRYVRFILAEAITVCRRYLVFTVCNCLNGI